MSDFWSRFRRNRGAVLGPGLFRPRPQRPSDRRPVTLTVVGVGEALMLGVTAGRILRWLFHSPSFGGSLLRALISMKTR